MLPSSMALVQRPDGNWAHDDEPEVCPNGHPLGPGQVLKYHMPCSCQGDRLGHRVFDCDTCHALIYLPPHLGPLPEIGAMH